MPPSWLERQKVEVAQRVAQADIVISTALIPGRAAPVLITEEMVKSMKAGSVIVDMAVEAGGNCSLSEINAVVVKHGVTLVGESNLPSLLPVNASQLYATNISTLALHLASKDGLSLDLEEEPAEVFADDAERQQLDRSHQQHRDQQRGITRRVDAQDQHAGDDEEGIEDGNGGDHHADIKPGAQGRS